MYIRKISMSFTVLTVLMLIQLGFPVVPKADGTAKWIPQEYWDDAGIGATYVQGLDTEIVTMGTSYADCCDQGFIMPGGGMCDRTFSNNLYGWGCYWTMTSNYPYCDWNGPQPYCTACVYADPNTPQGQLALAEMQPADKTQDLGKPNAGMDNGVSNKICLNSSADLKNGNVYFSQQVGPLTFSYNSLDTSDGPPGIGWTHDFNVSISPDPDGPSSLLLRRGDGNTIWFGAGAGNVYHAGAKSRDTSSIVINADGTYTRTTKERNVYNFSSSGKLASIADRNGNTTTLTYTGADLTGITDSTGRTIALGVSGGKIVSVTDFSSHSWTVSYSPAGLVSSIADPLGNTWSYQYDSNSRITQKTDPSNNTSYYSYDATSGQLTFSTDPNGVVKSIAYDTENGISTVAEKDGGVWIHKYNKVFNVPLEITDPYGNKTTYTYDSNNNLLSINYPDGTSKSLTYDSNRNVTSVTDAGGRKTTFTYNAQNRVTAIQDSSSGTTSMTYDAKGNLSSYKDPAGATTQFQRDSKGNITSVTDPLGHTIQYGYDQYNDVISVTDPTNVVVNLTRDISGNVLSLTDGLNNTANFVYDTAGRLTAAADPLGDVTSYSYDGNGNRSWIVDPMQNAASYTYNFRGLPTQKVDALGKVTSFNYVDTGCPSCGGGGEKLTSLTDAVGSRTAFAYDQRGLLTTVTDPLQQPTSLTYDVNGRPKTITNRNGNTLTYTTTPTGMISGITYPDQSQMAYTYDNLDRLTGVNDFFGASSFSYDADGRITGFTDPGGFTFSYTYDAAGNLTQVTYPDGSLAAYGYDAANRLLTVTNWLGSQATYAYDSAGRLAANIQFNGIPTVYTYDAAGRLIGISSAVASYEFTLDGNGNRVQSIESEPLKASLTAGGSTVYGYNAQKNRLLSAVSGSSLNYTYDNEGQLATVCNIGLAFDYNHRLTAVGTDAQFSYDGRGNRLLATRVGVATRYIYDPWGNLMAEANSNGITRKYIYGKGLLAVVDSSGLYCYHFDGSGNTVALTDTTQTVVNSYDYDPFGVILGQQESIPQPFKFVGQYGVMAEPNGLYYMRARYYDPSAGRFISEDPIGFAGGDVNLFAYALNDPINGVDPSGLQVQKPYSGDTGLLSSGPLIGGGGSGDLPSTLRQTMPGEVFIRYESGNPLYSRITSQGGVKPGTYAAPCDEGVKSQSDLASQYNLPDPQIPREVYYEIMPPPGTWVEGPKPVTGGTGFEVIFPFGAAPGSARPGSLLPP